MSRTKYRLTPAHQAQLGPWADRWIANAMSTAPLDAPAIHQAVRDLYAAAGLPPPRIVLVPSPFVAAFAGAFATAIWAATAAATRDATRAATGAATEAATGAATAAATRAATWAATWAATEAATGAATGAATWAATEAATWAATRAATWAATAAATRDATEAATAAATRDATEAATGAATWAATEAATDAATAAETAAAIGGETWWTGVGDMRAVATALVPSHAAHAAALFAATKHTWRMWNGGNQWSARLAFLSFFRHVAQLPLDYTHWDAYERCGLHGGPRVEHAKFCLVSARPVRLEVDAQRRPHSADGPFCAWADGTALWAWHGVRVPPAVILTDPRTWTATQVLHEPNAEVRRIRLERFGWDRLLAETAVRPQHQDATGTLYRIALPGDEPLVLVHVTNATPEPDGSVRRFLLRVPPTITRAHEAVAWTFGKTAEAYAPAVES